MALVKCPECGREKVSDTAACPDCGYGIKAHFEKVYKAEDYKKVRFRKEMRKKILLQTIICLQKNNDISLSHFDWNYFCYDSTIEYISEE